MSSRQDEKRARREAREAVERQEARSQVRRKRLSLAGGLVAITVTVVAAIALSLGGDPQQPQPGSGATEIVAAELPPRRVVRLADAVRLARAERITHPYAFGINEHTDEQVIDYPTNPPTNGPHAHSWTQDGNYAGQPAPPTAMVVHAQEHGRVVIQYRPGTSQRVLAQLVALYEESPRHVLLVENATGMNCEVAVTAWGQGLRCPTFTEQSIDAVRAFRDRFLDKGPETVA